MAIQVKINCGCGQNYAFDVEPVGGRMPSDVACPTCGADGTVAANDIIMHSAPAQPSVVAIPASKAPMRVAMPTAAPQPDATNASVNTPVTQEAAPTQSPLDLTRAINEARSKILWGDTRQQAIVCLVGHGISLKEASVVVDGLMKARAATIRSNGIGKIIGGIGCILVPVVTLAVFLYIRIILIKVLAITLLIGAWGAWLVLQGTLMTLAPKSEQGDANK